MVMHLGVTSERMHPPDEVGEEVTSDTTTELPSLILHSSIIIYKNINE